MKRAVLVHDYLTQRGGAERVALSLERALGGVPIYTSLYDPRRTFAEFSALDVRVMPLNRVALIRRHHRAALPLLAPAFSRLSLDADIVVCSSSGWAHGVRTSGRKIVYCHAPARWLYQTDRYVGARRRSIGAAVALLRRPLERWDRRAAASASRYVANSTVTARLVADVYAIEAEVVHPPVIVETGAARRPLVGVGPGAFACVSRLLAYKNVAAVVEAFARLPDEQLVVVGGGPELPRLRRIAGSNVRLAGEVDEAELRWVYANASGLIGASYEDFGLTPLEAAAFGTPTLALRGGGYLDTVVEGETGVFFDRPTAVEIARAVRSFGAMSWDRDRLRAHAGRFSEQRFAESIRRVISELLVDEGSLGQAPGAGA
jgi:glycosyltransferase involved in cell wall biosynthesis